MNVEQAKKILGSRARWELRAIARALSKLRYFNTEEEEQRLEAAKILLKIK